MIIPIDGSYKEYNKYYQMFSDTEHWDKLYFLLDDNLNPSQIKSKNVFTLPKINENSSFESKFEKINFLGNFTKFCKVDLEQNWPIYKSPKNQIECLKEKFRRISIVLEKEIKDGDLLLTNGTSHFFQRACGYIAKSKNIKIKSYTQSLIPDHEYVWVADESFSLVCNKIEDTDLPIQSYKEIKESVINGKIKKTYMSVFKRTLREEFESIRLIRNRFSLKYMTANRLLYLTEKLIFRKVRGIIWNVYSNKHLPTDKFAFFPLHMPGEAQTIVRGGREADDVALALKVADVLPEDMVLVVKEHPGYEGWKKISDLRKLLSQPNIFLVRSDISSHKIIEESKVIVTINSSVWFESIFFEKEIFTFGIGPFHDEEIVTECEHIDDLYYALIESKKNDYSPSETRKENRMKFVCKYANSSFKGRIYSYGLDSLSDFRDFIANGIL